jgi:hypothetical protein
VKTSPTPHNNTSSEEPRYKLRFIVLPPSREFDWREYSSNHQSVSIETA